MHHLSVQVKKCVDQGADMVRITVQGRQEALACYKIREQLFKDRCASVSLTASCAVFCIYTHVCKNIKHNTEEFDYQCYPLPQFTYLALITAPGTTLSPSC